MTSDCPPRGSPPLGLLAFALGCALSLVVATPAWILPAAAVAAAGILRRKVLAAAALLLAGLAAGNLRLPQPLLPSPGFPGPGEPPTHAWVRGAVRTSEAWKDGCRAEVDLSARLEGGVWLPASVRVQAYLPLPAPKEGSAIEASLRLVAPKAASNPGEFDRAAYLRRRGILLNASARSPGLVRLEPPHGIAPLASYREALRAALLRDGGREGGMLLALLLGERGLVNLDREEALARSGLYHLMALSGFNVGLVLLVVFGAAHLVGTTPLRRDMAGFTVCALYGLAVAERPSFSRALVMAGAFLVARAAGRPQPALRGWAFAAAALLVADPSELLDAGFQLTFLATLGILALHGAYPRGLPSEGWLGWLGKLFWVGFCAQLATLPALALQFHRVSPLGWLATPLAAVPLLGVQTLGLAYMAGGFAIPGLSGVLGWGMEVSSRAFCALPELLSSAPGGSLFVPKPWWGWVGMYAAGLTLLTVAARRRGAGWAMAAFACVGAWCAPHPFAPPPRAGVAVLDVGQASSQVLLGGTLPVLVDAGNGVYRGPSSARQVTEPFLASEGIRAVGAVLITHWDADHAGSLADLLRDLPVGFVAYAKASPPPIDIARLCGRMRVPLLALTAGDRIRCGGFEIRVAWPPREPPCASENDRCLVVRVYVGKGCVLFPGDIERCGEENLSRVGEDPSASLLLAPHHGAKRSCTTPFLRAVSPRWAIVSAGLHNRFGHPSAEAMTRMEECGIRTARTDRDGGIWVDFTRRTPTVHRWVAGDWSGEVRRPSR